MFKSPTSTATRKFCIYISPDVYGDNRLKTEIITHCCLVVTSMMSHIDRNKDVSFIDKMHRSTHAIENEMKTLLNDAGILRNPMSEAGEKVFKAR